MNRDKTQERGVALITGAARRIGAVIAEGLHDAGFDVVIHCHQSQKDAEHLAKHLNTKRENSAFVYAADLTVRANAEALITSAHAWKKRLDILVNNASNFIKTPVGERCEEASTALWQLNVAVPLMLSAAAYPHLKASNDGNIVNITDIHAEKPLKDYAVYSQTKAALKMQTEALAREYAPHVRVNAVAPGAVLKPEGDNALTKITESKILSKIPMGQWGEPKWIALAVLSLISNAYITGQTLRVDGGRSLN